MLKKRNQLERHIFWLLVKQAKKYTKHRENMRFCRTKAYGLARDLINALSKKLFEKKIIGAPDDVFYLELEELVKYRKNKVLARKLKSFARHRKAIFKKYKKMAPLPQRFTTQDLLSEYEVKNEQNYGQEGFIKGIGCSPGIVTAKAIVLMSFKNTASINKKILCTQQMDPGWVVLYPMCKGLLSERGSILSHSAIIAREMGIPAVIGIPNLTKNIKTGDTVKMDGSKGTAAILS